MIPALLLRNKLKITLEVYLFTLGVFEKQT